MRFFANDRVTLDDGTPGTVVEPHLETHLQYFDVGEAEAVAVYWVLLRGGQVCRFVETALTAA